jgi:hypothetical protein
MTREEYARNYSTSHAMDHGRSVIVPDNIQRVSESVPCVLTNAFSRERFKRIVDQAPAGYVAR